MHFNLGSSVQLLIETDQWLPASAPGSQVLLDILICAPKIPKSSTYFKTVLIIKITKILFVFIIRCSMGLIILGFTGIDRHYNVMKCWHYFSFNYDSRQTCLSNEWNEEMNECNFAGRDCLFHFLFMFQISAPCTRCCPYLGGCWKIAELII